jgi:phosphatidylglycerol:prolipoprotein diacylglycerol transferase
LPIRWYSLAYIFGIALGWFYALRLLRKPDLWPAAGAPVNRAQLDDVIFWVALGVIAGGRLGYVLFYEPALLVGAWEPLGANMEAGVIKTLTGWIPIPPALMLWRGGMAFHGGLIGVAVAGLLYARRNKVNALSLGDLFACAAPIGLFFGRLANFVNAELYGRAWSGPWAMVFPTDPTGLARHPSQLYEAALEGLLLFVIIRIASVNFGLLKKPGATIGLFLAGYAGSRIFVENFREPDPFLPNFPLGLTMGMMLSLPMLAIGAFLIWRAFRPAPRPAT